SAAEAEALAEKVRLLAVELLDDWEKIARELFDKGGTLQYQKEVGDAPRLLYEFLSPELKGLPPRQRKFRANRSMRNVEPAVNLGVRARDNAAGEDEGGAPVGAPAGTARSAVARSSRPSAPAPCSTCRCSPSSSAASTTGPASARRSTSRAWSRSSSAS